MVALGPLSTSSLAVRAQEPSLMTLTRALEPNALESSTQEGLSSVASKAPASVEGCLDMLCSGKLPGSPQYRKVLNSLVPGSST